MNDWKEAKQKYDETPLPPNLDDITRQMIEKNRPRPRYTALRRTAAAAAACLCLLVVGAGVSPTFANGLEKVPVLGQLVKISDHFSNRGSDGDKTVNAHTPQIEAADPTVDADTLEQMNTEIQKIVDQYIKKADSDIAAYKEAFLATGGTEEEFAEKNIQVDVSYQVMHQTDHLLSLVLTANENWCGAYDVKYYYNLDLTTGETVTLEDLLGEDYVSVASAQIVQQIEERIAADDSLSFFGYNTEEFQDSKFTTLREDANFYLNEAGNPVIVFAKYEIAPGYMGSPEFEILP